MPSPHFATLPACKGLAMLTACIGLLAPVARAEGDRPAPSTGERPFTYALGAAIVAAPTYAGSGGQDVKLRPLWGVRLGRFRISGARASGLLAAPGDAVHSPKSIFAVGLTLLPVIVNPPALRATEARA